LRLGNARIIGVTLALLVSVLAIAAPWSATPRCAGMLEPVASTTAMSCTTEAPVTIASACDDMRAGSPVSAVASDRVPSVPDLVALAPAAVALRDVRAARAITVAPTEDPPRLVLDTSRLRI